MLKKKIIQEEENIFRSETPKFYAKIIKRTQDEKEVNLYDILAKK